MGDISIGGAKPAPQARDITPPVEAKKPPVEARKDPAPAGDGYEAKKAVPTGPSNTANFAAFNKGDAPKAKGTLKASDLQAASFASPRGEAKGVDSPDKGAPAKAATANYDKIKEPLTRGILDPVISDNDVSNVHKELGKLPPDEYKKTLARMEKDGLLSTYTSEMEDKHVDAFANQAREKGAAELSGSHPATTGTDVYSGKHEADRPLQPPRTPSYYKYEGQSPEMQKVLMKANDNIGKEYQKSYDAYKERYQSSLAEIRKEAADTGDKGAALRKLRELGAPARRVNYHKGIPDGGTVDPQIQRDIDVTHARILGRKPSGLGISVKAGVEKGGKGISTTLGTDTAGDPRGEVTTKFGVGDNSVSSTHKGTLRDGGIREREHILNGKAGKYGEVEVGTKGSKVHAGPLGAGVDDKGKKNYTIGTTDNHVKAGPEEVGFNAKAKDTEVGANVGVKGKELSISGKAEVEGTGGAVSGKVDESAGSASLGGEGKVNGVTLGAGVDFQGVDPKTAHRSMPNADNQWPGVHGVPRELQADVAWGDLPKAKQDLYATELGWNAKEWDAYRSK